MEDEGDGVRGGKCARVCPLGEGRFSDYPTRTENGIAGGCCPHLFRFEGPDAMLFAFSDDGLADETCTRLICFTGRVTTSCDTAKVADG